MNTMIVSPTKGALVVDPDVFRAEAERRWQPHVTLRYSLDAHWAVVERPDEPFFQAYVPDGQPIVVIEANPEQAREIALWVRSWVDPTVPLWLISEDYSAHAEIHPGSLGDWVEHGADFVDPLVDH